MDLTETRLDGAVLYDGKILRLERDRVRLPDGSTSAREVVRHCAGAAILLVRDGRILLVRQYRYAFSDALWEIPAGKVDPADPDPKSAALRELAEETGWIASDAQLLTAFCPSPGYTDEVIWVYCATEAHAGKRHPDAGEFIESRWFSAGDIDAMARDGRLRDAKTLLAVLLRPASPPKNGAKD